MDAETGLSDDFINKLASIHMRITVCLHRMDAGEGWLVEQLRDRLADQLRHVPSYTEYAKRELVPKIAGLEEEDVLNDDTSARVRELDRVVDRLHELGRTGVRMDRLIALLHQGYALVAGPRFAEEKIGQLKRSVAGHEQQLHF